MPDDTNSMKTAHGPWRIERHVPKYANEFIELVEDHVTRPDGRPGTYATVTLKSGVAALAVDADQRVYLARQFRYAAGRETTEVPSGGLEPGEEPLVAAQRELREELGIEAAAWTSLGRLELEGSIVRCSVDLFLARTLTRTRKDQDGTEDVRTLKVSLAAAVGMVMDGQIDHAPSCVVILKAGRELGLVSLRG